MQVCKIIFMEVCKYKYGSVYENMQETIQICKYEKYAGMYVYTN